MADNGSDRLARMEEAITTMAIAVKSLSESTARGFETLVSMVQVLETRIKLLEEIFEARMGVLEGQMTEVLGRLRIIGEQLAAHIGDGHGHEAA